MKGYQNNINFNAKVIGVKFVCLSVTKHVEYQNIFLRIFGIRKNYITPWGKTN